MRMLNPNEVAAVSGGAQSSALFPGTADIVVQIGTTTIATLGAAMPVTVGGINLATVAPTSVERDRTGGS